MYIYLESTLSSRHAASPVHAAAQLLPNLHVCPPTTDVCCVIPRVGGVSAAKISKYAEIDTALAEVWRRDQE
eukprot:m.147552 g.147552  ORF g.147552 m.147552 type:complete len:72 (-) comp23151_c0_seq2:55-270(-)